MTRLAALLLSVTLLLVACAPRYAAFDPERRPDPARDARAHDLPVEWWYYTGHLETESGRRLGVQLVFFQAFIPSSLDLLGFIPAGWFVQEPLYFAHAAVTDEDAGTFVYAEQSTFPAGPPAGAYRDRYRVFLGAWSAEQQGDTHLLSVSTPEFAFELRAKPSRPPVIHGPGYSGTPETGRSYYYSFTRLATTGAIALDGRVERVTGRLWHDHQWGEIGQVKPDWDWWGLVLDDGADLMLYEVRLGGRRAGLGGTLVLPDGRVIDLQPGDFQITATGSWTSPHTGITYPMGWRIALPAYEYDLLVHPRVLDQELRTPGSTRVTYWEGSVEVLGSGPGGAVAGEGYVELIGAAP